MATYECELHELQWGIPMCRSVYDALIAVRRPEVVAVFDRDGVAYLLCPSCAEKARAVVTAEEGTLDGDALNFRFEGRTMGDCIICLDERLTAAGLPAVSELLDEARARRDASR